MYHYVRSAWNYSYNNKDTFNFKEICACFLFDNEDLLVFEKIYGNAGSSKE